MSTWVSHNRSTDREGTSAQIPLIPHHSIRNEGEEVYASLLYPVISADADAELMASREARTVSGVFFFFYSTAPFYVPLINRPATVNMMSSC